ncbi:MAG: SAM-dependent methyltransferase [Flavobacteriaceae bacterium TMED200]|nr:MAG: SAM-dependent methyltransferase [Flavobacteriaceae bacterium TMED200]
MLLGSLKKYITSLHQSTNRKYLDRMIDDKVACMIEAKKYSFNYWDGDRRFGFGGYKYIPGRWKPMAEELIKDYNLNNGSKVLDVGCGKGFLLLELKKILPELSIVGFDISEYAINNLPDELKSSCFIYDAKNKFKFKENEFNLVISINTIHNLKLYDLKNTIKEIERVGEKKYLATESYRNEKELFNLQCWALTCESFFDHDTWLEIFKECNFTGDYEFIYFE